MKSLRIIAKDTDGNVLENGRLEDWLVAEVEFQNARCILTAGAWYRIAEEYVEEINIKINKIPVIKKRNYLHPMLVQNGKIEAEDKYNIRCDTKFYSCLDRQTIQMDRYGKIELCDLYREPCHLIHVKKQTSSGTLSHLWSQGLVSGELLKDSEEFRCKAQSKFKDVTELRDSVPKKNFDSEKFTVVYAIATKADDFPSCLPFFSKVNLLYNYKHLQRLGYKVKLVKIEYKEE